MNNPRFKQLLHHSLYMFFYAISCSQASAALLDAKNKITRYDDVQHSVSKDENTYVATNNSVQQLFFVIGGALNKPFIVSSEAAKKRISGNFDLSHPKALLSTIASRTGLIWYDDGSSVYVYDANEIKSQMVSLSYAPFERLVAFIKSSGLYDASYPLRSDGETNSFYVSGPPIYVQLIIAAAKYIDQSYARPGVGQTTIRIIKLKNTFVNDRTFTLRDKPVTIPGVATVLNQLLNGAASSSIGGTVAAGAKVTVDDETKNALQAAMHDQNGRFASLPSFNTFSSSNESKSNNYSDVESPSSLNIIGYSDTNSILVEGTSRQVSYVEDLINALDIPKQQIQLSLWILDISKDDMNEMGIRWQGSAKLGNNGVTFNTSTLTPQNSLHFLADVSALVQNGNAEIVSRPEILTQENIPALFDNNSSFYAKLVGERASSLEKITYGTMISVLPRLSQHQQEIEMILNIQDGGLPLGSDGQTSTVDSLPIVNNTQISTEARVPINYSLLVGGYSRNQDEYHRVGIPLLRDIPGLGKLFDYSYTSHKKMVRLFLIQPRLLDRAETWHGTSMGDDNPVLGQTLMGSDVTLKSTVAMLRQMMMKK